MPLLVFLALLLGDIGVSSEFFHLPGLKTFQESKMACLEEGGKLVELKTVEDVQDLETYRIGETYSDSEELC